MEKRIIKKQSYATNKKDNKRVRVIEDSISINSWQEVIHKINAKLSKWKAKTSYVGGRLTLIKSNLGAIPTYFMSLYRAPEAVLKHIERMRNSFFLGAELEERKITWVSWKTMMAEKQFGGRFLNHQTGLWQSIIKAIHGPNGSLDAPIPRRSGGSVWVMIRKSIDSLKSKRIDLMQFCNQSHWEWVFY
ncbi:ribonuclease H protein [Artemisia annua]|uniref:Ribonuclease H protein n=1 Tax=Artemisia annua TaxID=35608 RepID=A0A2U1M8W9_ARTAN|nr:ribonuclease H protein [Artemisia annua]